MFLNAYQSGPFVEVMSSSDKNPIWSTNKPVNRKFDKESKGYTVLLESINSKLQIPSTEKPLVLTQGYLLLQIFVLPAQPFTLELSLTDSQCTKRRLVFSSASKEITIHPLHARVPNCSFPRSTWTNLCIDLHNWTLACFMTNFRSLDSITVSSYCKLRKIFTLKNDPNEESLESICRNLEFPCGVQFLSKTISPDPTISKVAQDEEGKNSKKAVKRPPITTAPIENVKRLTLTSGIMQKKQGKTANTFYTQKTIENKPVDLPIVTERINQNLKQDSLAVRRFSVGGNYELDLIEKPESPIPFEINVQDSPKGVDQESRLNDFQYLTNYRNSVETMTNSIEEEIVIESCLMEGYEEERPESVKHNFFPQTKVEVCCDKPSFFTSKVSLATKLRPFTPPFVGLDGMKSPNHEEILEEVPEIFHELVTEMRAKGKNNGFF